MCVLGSGLWNYNCTNNLVSDDTTTKCSFSKEHGLKILKTVKWNWKIKSKFLGIIRQCKTEIIIDQEKLLAQTYCIYRMIQRGK